MLAIGDDACFSGERYAFIPGFDRAGALADIPSALPFRCGRCEQQLIGTESAQQTPMPGAVHAMAYDQGYFGLMHCIDHRCRGTSAAKHVTDVDDIREAGALAAEIVWHHDSQQ